MRIFKDTNKTGLKNTDKLATSTRRKAVLKLMTAGLGRADAGDLMRAAVGYSREFNSLKAQNSTYDLIKGRIFVIGGGKAAGAMAMALEEVIGPENITAGGVVGIDTGYKTEKIKIFKGGHPIPNEGGISAVRRIMSLKKKYDIGEEDLVICLLSGGASALLPCPADSIRLKDKQITTDLLLRSGADIGEINTVRKHLSQTKGGGLGRFFYPAPVVSIVISDVAGNDPAVIASGPTVPDPTTFKDAYGVIRKYGLDDKIPRRVSAYLLRGLEGRAEETPKELVNCSYHVIGDNAVILEAMARFAKSSGFTPKIITPELSGDPEATAIRLAREIMSGKYTGYDVLLAGGETALKLPAKHGRGGRNRHLAAVFSVAMEDYSGEWAAAFVSTDGIDYLSNAAGAIVDDGTLGIVRSKKTDIVSYIKKFDTDNLFKRIGNSLVITGPTGTNVGDIFVCVL
ncbi:MAG: DUF4147 domain-containing protein [Candidatus Falkowbacteria bacterium]